VYLIADPNAPALSGCSFSAIGFTADGWRYVTLTANQQRTIVATYGQDVGTKITVAAGQNALYDLHFGCN